ncbi:hypothetical protein CU254_42640 (plasmid) [Amycolatopsis sp. AA4]|nr:hypothetical protein CU254_42640 [Amycolatopsis sp. AA4]
MRVGDTYVVEVPHSLPMSRYPARDEAGGFAEWWRLQTLRGGRFRLTVTEIDAAAAPPMAEGIRVVSRSWVRVDLTLEQAEQLGLPPGEYSVDGLLRDAAGRTVELPEVSPVRVPVRWLRPGDFERTPPTHRDLDRLGW